MPLDLFEQQENQIAKIVKQNYNITFSRQPKTGIYAKRIMSCILAQIKEDEALASYYRFHVSDVINPRDKGSEKPYGQIKKAMNELIKMSWAIEDKKKQIYKPYTLVATNNDDWGYENGYITVVINHKLEKHFIEMSHYTTYERKYLMHFKEWYSLRLWELLSAFDDDGIWKPKIETFALYMDCKGKYLKGNKGDKNREINASKLISATTDTAKKAFEGTPLAFTVKGTIDKHDKSKSSGRKKITHIEFRMHKRLKQIKLDRKDIALTDEYKNLLNELHSEWKVTQKQLKKYASVIGFKAASKLKYDWRVKQLSQHRITNLETYCTTAWNSVGREKSQSSMNNVEGFFKEKNQN